MFQDFFDLYRVPVYYTRPGLPLCRSPWRGGAMLSEPTRDRPARSDDDGRRYAILNNMEPDKKPAIKPDKDLSSELYAVARQGGTEAPFTGKYLNSHERGMFRCAVCGTELFSSDTKFDSGTGWPSFTEPANLENIELRHDTSDGMDRTEVICKNCGAHLGHVFDDGPKEKGGKRYCINSVCLDLQKKGEDEK